MNYLDDLALARSFAADIAHLGGKVYLVGGGVRDKLLGLDVKDVDVEVYGVSPAQLRQTLSKYGTVLEKGASFGVLGLKHSDIDVAMPRTESRTGAGHKDFAVSVDPFLPPQRASMRRDFTINAMMEDIITGEILDFWGGREDLQRRIIRHVSDETFGDDALRAFRCAQFAARLDAQVAPETMEICRQMDVSALSRERVLEETNKAILRAEKPSVYFELLRQMDHLKEFFPELAATIGVEQNPIYHPEGDVFCHTMLVIDNAASLRERAKKPLWFMYAALLHDLGKITATTKDEFGKITSHGHEVYGMPMAVEQMRRLTNEEDFIKYVENMVFLHMRPNMLAKSQSKKRKSRMMFDLSLCPEDLILLARADAQGKTDKPYNLAYQDFLNIRLQDYYGVIARGMIGGKDLIAAGFTPGVEMGEAIKRGRVLLFCGLDKRHAIKQLQGEFHIEKPQK